ncbi:putative bifunctional diguanylate cyclase/phosphodiesterase [Thioalkalivibrio thiocyanodenitrificans]|uniref:putative bifunctional diguanylate cyclase/phosphodiesterase n=1 Tax=Thioalkalivibrio thiocyanodenitrificans TaxID=243063 RepID=UPI0003A5FE5B|nr:bifunctional diguanylate cyclase/phosphodiesterase [Thioalkalivibrio thiocyanodenitrificans]
MPSEVAKTWHHALPDMEVMKRRVEHLEKTNQWHSYAMDVLGSMTAIFGDNQRNRDTQSILRNAHECLSRIISFDEAGFYTVDDESSFDLSYAQPDGSEAGIDAEVEVFIRNGMFAWAINQNHPVCLPSRDRQSTIILHVISTRSRIRGMFAGRLSEEQAGTTEAALKLLSIVLFNTAYALESAALYSLMDQQQRTLKKITERQSEELVHQYSHDLLTNLPNRVLFVDRLEQLIARRSARDTNLAVILLDLDNFKRVNDSLGHRAGDLLIKLLGTELHRTFLTDEISRRFDLEPASITLSRLGGDEFGLILDGVESLDLVVRAVQHLIGIISREHDVEGHQVFLTCSVGISVFPYDGENADTLIKNADAAMYDAKQRGRNSFRFYTREINSQTYRQLILENDLVKALARKEFEVYYQPQVELDTGRVIGAEALLRWRHPEKGIQPPANFIAIAEETGLIEGLGLWVLQEVCEDLSRLGRDGAETPRISINLSARQFRQSNLVEQYRAVIQETGTDPGRLELELTESTIMKDIDIAVGMFQQLHSLGVRLAIDDFGTGYSSLNNLKHFPIDTLKVDRSFVCDIPDDKDDSAIVTAIVAMAKSLHLEVVAEGVETREQLEFLRRLGCEIVQGYFYSEPLPFEQFRTLLNGWTATA